MKTLTNAFSKIAFTITLIAVAGCATVEGIGKDLESAGDKAEEVTRND